MAAFAKLLGASLAKGSASVATAEALSGKAAVALYFSAHWCPPCRGFTPKLVEWYSANLKAKGLEVIFVSSDRDESSFKEYYGEQPWLALPFSEREKKNELSKKFKVQGIPTLVILDAEGKTITTDGRSAVSEDPTGEEFPWKPVPLKDVLKGAKLLRSGGEVVTLEEALKDKKALALYFSAHWCPPCRGFTPKLAEWYTENLKNKGLEVVFVSWDREEDAFKEYFGSMPWLALEFADKKTGKQLNSAFKVDGIPSLVILDAELNTITTEGREAISQDPKGAEFPWHPKPVRDLAAGPGPINEVPTLIAFAETSPAAEQEAVEAALAPVGQKHLDQQKAQGESEPEVSFIIAKAAGGLAGRIRSMLGLPALPPKPHEHPLAKQEPRGGWVCDGCGNPADPDTDRFRCAEGCDFDFCGTCNSKAGGGGGASVPPRLALIDIPSDGAFYLAPEGPITSDVVTKFLEDFKAGKLERQQLSG